MARPEARGQLPVLALDVVNDRAARPGQQGRHDQADTLAASRRRKAQNVLRSVMAQVVGAELAQHYAIGTHQTRVACLAHCRPARRAVGGHVLGLARAPDRHADRHGNRDQSSRGRDEGAFDEDGRRIGVIRVPPPEEGGREVDRTRRRARTRAARAGADSPAARLSIAWRPTG